MSEPSLFALLLLALPVNTQLISNANPLRALQRIGYMLFNCQCGRTEGLAASSSKDQRFNNNNQKKRQTADPHALLDEYWSYSELHLVKCQFYFHIQAKKRNNRRIRKVLELLWKATDTDDMQYSRNRCTASNKILTLLMRDDRSRENLLLNS